MTTETNTEFFAESAEASNIRMLEDQLATANATKDAIAAELVRIASIVDGSTPCDTAHALSIIRRALNVTPIC
jgi:hypothetical protein